MEDLRKINLLLDKELAEHLNSKLKKTATPNLYRVAVLQQLSRIKEH